MYPNGNATIPEGGQRLIDGNYVNEQGLAGGLNRTTMTVKALVGGGQPGAGVSLLGAAIVEITTVATAADSCQLPVATGNQVMDVVNTGASSARIYPNANEPTDTINGAANYDLAAGARVRFFSTQTGKWFANLSA